MPSRTDTLDALVLRELDLEALLQATWELLEEGVARSNNPFHTPTLATLGDDGPEARTVVLRGVDRGNRILSCHTDARSPKVSQIERANAVAWSFYDAGRKLQVRANGYATLHREDALADARWRRSSPRSRVCYAAEYAPGQTLPEPPAPPTGEAGGFSRFTVVACQVERLEALVLAASGHRRARWQWRGERCLSAWIAP